MPMNFVFAGGTRCQTSGLLDKCLSFSKGKSKNILMSLKIMSAVCFKKIQYNHLYRYREIMGKGLTVKFGSMLCLAHFFPINSEL